MPQQTLNTPRETTHQRIAAALEAIEQNMSDEHEAVNIDYDNTNSDLSADNVQEAIDELSSEKANTTDLGTAASKDVPTSGNATSTQVVMGNDSRLSDSRPASDVSSWAKTPTKPTYTASEVGAYAKTESDNKYVIKETGKGLSTNDYTTTEKNKLASIEAEANKTVVDSVMSDSSTNPLQNKVITKELEGAKTTTGNPLTIEDAAPVNAVNLSMDLEPIQDLHGYDHPWVGGAGKNKLPMTVEGIKSANTSGTWSGNVYTYNGVSFTILTDLNNNVTGIKVNGTASATLFFVLNTNLSFTVQTILNGNTLPNASESNCLRFIDGGGNSRTDLGSGVSIPANFAGQTQIRLNSGYSVSNIILYPMIRLSTETDATFAPYSNICPISGRSEEIVTIKDNPSEPSVTKNYTIQLGQTVYGGQLDVTRGKMVVDKGYAEFDGSSDEDWKAHQSIASWFFIDNSLPNAFYNNNQNYFIVTNTYTQKPYNDVTDLSNGEFAFGLSGGAKRFVVKNTNYTTASDFISHLASNPLQVVYKLATPFTIPLTPQQIKMLENTNTISTDYDGDTITIEYQPNNSIGEAVRAVEESYDPKFAVRPPLKKKAFSGTTDSDGAVTLINASDIPSGHKIIPLQITDMTINGSVGTYFVEYKPFNSGDSVKGYCYTYFNGSQITPVGTVVTGNFYYYDLEV